MSQNDHPCLHKAMLVVAMAAVSALAIPGVASAQLTKAEEHRIVFGHLHVHPTDAEAHRKFWVETLGGTLTHVGTMEAALYLDGLIEWISPSFAEGPPAGGTQATTVDHVAFSVRDLKAVLARVTADSYAIVTDTEFASTSGEASDNVAFVMGPDDVLVELVEAPEQTASIAMHHIHFAVPQAADIADMEGWYVKLLGATRGERGTTMKSAIPGSGLTFSPASTPVVGTKGRVLDHIGFEVRNLKAFTEQLETMGVEVERFVETELPSFGPITIAYLTDPWGTYIELSEGLDKVQ